jgi:ectoine hydroxylase-related dioxygenase (phytanoyl-CoA dioxygenase family)
VIYFDKTPDTNWRVVWHQDLSIAVAQEVSAPGYGPWSEKDGVVHVHPPSSVLEQMLAVRVHLDDCDATNGPVRVLSGSHRSGRMTPAEIDKWKAGATPTECHARRGGVLAFRPLVLHASSPALSPKHRRVIHFEFAAAALADGVHWHSWVGADADGDDSRTAPARRILM